MTIAAYLRALLDAINALKSEIQNMASGMTPEQAQQLGALVAQVAQLQADVEAVKADVAALKSAQGDIASLPPL